MKTFVWHILLCVALAASAWASNKVDAEQVAKEHKASFHWFPVQKTFLLAGENDTLKFAIGLPYVSSHGSSMELKHAPEITDGHILLDSADVASLYKTDHTQTAPAIPASSSSLAKVSSSSAKIVAASTPAPTAAPAAVPAAPVVSKPKNETAGKLFRQQSPQRRKTKPPVPAKSRPS